MKHIAAGRECRMGGLLGGRVEWSAPGAHCVTCLPGSKSVDSGDRRAAREPLFISCTISRGGSWKGRDPAERRRPPPATALASGLLGTALGAVRSGGDGRRVMLRGLEHARRLRLEVRRLEVRRGLGRHLVAAHPASEEGGGVGWGCGGGKSYFYGERRRGRRRGECGVAPGELLLLLLEPLDLELADRLLFCRAALRRARVVRLALLGAPVKRALRT